MFAADRKCHEVVVPFDSPDMTSIYFRVVGQW